MDMVIDTIKRIMPNRKVIFVFDRGFADEKLMKYMNYFDSDYIIRVPQNCGIVGLEYKGKLATFDHWGYFKDMSYHIRERIKVNLLSAKEKRVLWRRLKIAHNFSGGLKEYKRLSAVGTTEKLNSFVPTGLCYL